MTINEMLEMTEMFGPEDERDTIVEKVLGIGGELGEWMEALSDDSREGRHEELADILIYLFLYVKATKCGFHSIHPFSLVGSVKSFTGVCCSVLKLLEYEKKVFGDREIRNLTLCQAMATDILIWIMRLATTYEVDLEQMFLKVTIRNQERYLRGDYDRRIR